MRSAVNVFANAVTVARIDSASLCAGITTESRSGARTDGSSEAGSSRDARSVTATSVRRLVRKMRPTEVDGCAVRRHECKRRLRHRHREHGSTCTGAHGSDKTTVRRRHVELHAASAAGRYRRRYELATSQRATEVGRDDHVVRPLGARRDTRYPAAVCAALDLEVNLGAGPAFQAYVDLPRQAHRLRGHHFADGSRGPHESEAI